ncbi:ubiquitin-like domain-containing protein [Paenibacillus tarimensis]|uniref:ubiquitin-like domain-containing protein n=1 Tax=Paenibacillus tarimensis TaxID=416012 RepID=UPI0038B33F3E
MGAFQIKESHGKRSSSMTFALRWKHENLRLILLSGIISIAMTFMFLVLLYGTADKSVSVVVNGQETVVSTKQWVLQRLLDEQAITVGPHDKVSHPLDAPVKDGDQVVIDQAVQVTVKADGKSKTFYTTGKTVGAAIEQSNIAIREQDKVFPALNAELKAHMAVSVTRVDKKLTETEHTMPFTVVKRKDPNLEVGQQKVVQEGQEGLIVKQFEKVYEDGQLVENRLVTKYMETSKRDHIVAVGTKKPEPKVEILTAQSSSAGATVTKQGVSFKSKKVLKNVTLTAYSAGVASTGKSENHPQYGITASGARVKEGRTIAVDPKVIPIGWWVYIEGIGFRRAEDTGSAIKGNKIDVYFDSESYALKFGRKKGYTVYVLGPNKPSAS